MQRKRSQHSRSVIADPVEICENRFLLTAITNLENGQLFVLPSKEPPVIYDAAIVVDREVGTAVARPVEFGISVAFREPSVSGAFSSYSRFWTLPKGDVWVDDITQGKWTVYRGTLDELTRLKPHELDAWLIDGHTYRVFFRFSHGSANAQSGAPGPWSAGYDFRVSQSASLSAVRDGVSMASAGLGIDVPASVVAFDRDGMGIEYGRKIFAFRKYTRRYEVEVRNVQTSELYASLSLPLTDSTRVILAPGVQDLGQYLPVDPVPPGRYSIRMRSLEGYRESNAAEAVEAWTEWSVPQVFNIYVQPVVITSGGGSTLDSTPTFRWNAVTDAVSYDVWIGKSVGSQFVYSRSGIAGLKHTVNTSLPQGDYQVYVRARLSGGGVSQWGSGLGLSIGAPIVPVVNAAAHSLSWSRVPDATRYEIWVDYLGGAASAGTRVIHETRWRRTEFTLPARSVTGTYRIWIRAILDEGRSEHRSTWSRSVDIVVAENAAIDGHDTVMLGSASRDLDPIRLSHIDVVLPDSPLSRSETSRKSDSRPSSRSGTAHRNDSDVAQDVRADAGTVSVDGSSLFPPHRRYCDQLEDQLIDIVVSDEDFCELLG